MIATPPTYDQVTEFHRAFNLTVNPGPVALETVPEEIRQLRVRLLDEEHDEYRDADTDNDLVGVADALADMTYIAFGTAVVYGFDPTPEAARVRVLLQPTSSDAPRFPDMDVRAARRDALAASMAAYHAAERRDSASAIQACIARLLCDVMLTAARHHIDLPAVLDEVHRSNMSKLDASGQPIFRADGKVLKSELYRPPDIASVLASTANAA